MVVISREEPERGRDSEPGRRSSANMTLDDTLNMVFVGEDAQFRDLTSPIQGPFCYIYK
jgi:hypothetical protein